MGERVAVDDRLDYLYNRTVRCPYCGERILKYTAVCGRCGVHKRQILSASNKRAKQIKKQRTGEVILMTRTRPDDVSFTAMALLLIFGLFGAHNFHVGRKIRGWIMCVCAVVGIILAFVFPPPIDGQGGEVRSVFTDMGWPFPTDLLVVIAFVMWAYDAFSVVFGFYKYPVRLGDK